MPSAANGSIGSGPEQPKQDEGACVETPAWMLKGSTGLLAINRLSGFGD
jgi:hypothetical protein